jgi:hypothetical protein
MSRSRNSNRSTRVVGQQPIIPDIVGYQQKERAAADSVSRLKNQAVADVNKDYPQSTTRKGGKGGTSPMDRYTQMLQSLLTGGGYKKPFDDLTAQLNTMGQQAQGTVNTSMDQLKTFLQGQTNPFEGMTAQQTAVQPGLAALLQSQGVSADPLQQYANTVNTQNAGAANSTQGVMDTLRGIYGANQTGALADVETNRANLQSQLGANQMGWGSQIGRQAMGQQNELMSMLMQAIAKGGRPRGGRLF